MPHQGTTGGHAAPVNFTQVSNTSITSPAIGNPTFTNPKFKGLGNGTSPIPTDGLIQRGYMRLLTEVFEYGNEGNRLENVSRALDHDLGTKLDFQFNPNELTRAVTARTDTQLWINQSPSQLLQPGIGDMSFSWQMLFNREAEVQKGEVFGRQKSPSELEVGRSGEDFQARLDQFSARNAASSDKAAEELGVLADIAILDRITGQSISKEAIQYAQDRYDRLVASGAITEEDAVDEENSIADRAEAAGVDLMSANVQNSAFLVPNPIRVVFSENFMVDGYVNSVVVSFKKFSPQMVPTVALVDVSMHAIYQGFSRYKSTFTTLLELAEAEVAEGEVTAAEAGTSVADLQDACKYSPVLDAFDHSPPVDLNWTSDLWESLNPFQPGGVGIDRVVADPETKLDMHKYAKDKSSQVMNGQIAQPFKIDKGLSFGVLSSLKDGREGSEAIRRHYKSGNLLQSELTASVSTGLRIHARLRPHQPGSGSGSGTTAAAAMEALLSGDDDGFADHNTDTVFFGNWPKAQRTLLLARGDGFDQPPLGGSTGRGRGAVGRTKLNYDEFNAQTSSTRSFPIITCEQGSGLLPADAYGDLLGMHEAHYESGQVIVEDDCISLEWREANKSHKWQEDDTLYYVGLGFYDADDDNKSFPSEITITHKDNTTPANDLVFKVDYQMHVLVRTKLSYQGFLLSDTGWLRIHPRSSNSLLFPEGGLLNNSKSTNLKGSMVGNLSVAGPHLDDARFPWQHDQRGTKQHFDGHTLHKDGCTQWSHARTSDRLLDHAIDLDDMRVYISHDSKHTQGYD